MPDFYFRDVDSDTQLRPLPLVFSGSGAEYFRIWIVNLLLTIVTLGIYSAWAKVRRLQYFDRNTTLDGAALDFHGKPAAILKGRLVALALLAGYHYAFGFSVTVGLAVFGALLLILPWLLRGALRFRLHNTTWRGLRFGFTGSTPGAYATFIPPMLTVMAPVLAGVMVTRGGTHGPSPWAGLFALLYLAWPVFHANIKRYQHAHVRYGGADAFYMLPSRRFWGPYLIVFGVTLALIIAAGVAIAIAARGAPVGKPPTVMLFLPITLAYVGILAMLPYLQARLGNLVWCGTAFTGVEITSDLTFRGLLKLHAVNTLLTVLTVGLYRPFAVVRLQRYVLEHLHVSAGIDFDALHDDGSEARVGGAGDGAADFAGFDIAL